MDERSFKIIGIEKSSYGTFPDYISDELKEKLLNTILPKKKEVHCVVWINKRSSIVNSIRRVLLGECQVKVISCNPNEIETNSKRIRKIDLANSIAMVKIPQDTEIKTYHVSKENKTKKRDYLWSGSLKLEGVPSQIRLAELLYMDNIKFPFTIDVKQHHAACQLAVITRYMESEYVSISYLSEKHRLKDGILPLENYLKATGKSRNDMVPPAKQKVTSPDLFIWNHDRSLVEEMYGNRNIIMKDVSKFLVSSSRIDPVGYYLGIKTYGNIPVDKIWEMVFDNIMDRLRKILSWIQNDNVSFIKFIREDTSNDYGLSLVHISENATIVEIIVDKMRPKVSNINYIREEHEIIISIVAEQPDKLIESACNELINEFEKMKSEISL